MYMSKDTRETGQWTLSDFLSKEHPSVINFPLQNYNPECDFKRFHAYIQSNRNKMKAISFKVEQHLEDLPSKKLMMS